MPIPAGIVAPKANDIFLHALFARMTLTNNDVVEFFTKYDQLQDQIELYIPQEALNQLSQLTGIKQGPKFKAYIAWLIGRNQIIADAQGGGGGGINWVTNTLTTFDGVPQNIAEIAIPDNTMYLVDARITSRRTDDIGHGGFIRHAVIWRENGGPAVIEGALDVAAAVQTAFSRRSPFGRGVVGATITVDGVSDSAFIEVTGKAGQTFNWQSQYIFNAST